MQAVFNGLYSITRQLLPTSHLYLVGISGNDTRAMHALLKWKLKKNLSFSEIGKRTGFTRTKVHRQLIGKTKISVKDAFIYSIRATKKRVSVEVILGLDPKRGAAHARKS